MGTIGDAYDTAHCERSFHTLQLELLDEHHSPSRRQLGSAIVQWIETGYSPSLCHCSIQMLSHIDHELQMTAAPAA